MKSLDNAIFTKRREQLRKDTARKQFLKANLEFKEKLPQRISNDLDLIIESDDEIGEATHG
eukprot:11684128-Karenia_brevis.AAC.1